jgi:hypothetical protein
MWQHYRKTIVVVQLFILALCTAMKFLLSMPWLAVGVLFLVMQPGALLGTWYGVRMRERAVAKEDDLPLRRRR